MAENWQLKAVLSANAEGMLKTLKTVNQATASTRKHLVDMVSSAGRLAANIGMPLGLIGTALGAFSVAGIKTAVGNFAELGDHVVKSAKRVGMSTDDFQQLSYMAGQSGISVEGLSTSMGRLNKNIGMAANGKNKDLAELFHKAGISMRDANGNMRSSADMLPEIADLFQRNGNAALQARMGNAIFGKGWQELAPLLLDGSEGIGELTRRYKMLGLGVEEGALKAGEKFGDQMDDLHQVLRSYGNTISSKLIPILSPMVEQTIQWAVANRELITTNVTNFIGDMAREMAKIDWPGVVKGIGDFFIGARDLVNELGGAKNVLIGLAIVMNAQALVATMSLAGSFGRLGLSIAGMATQATLGAGGMATLSGAMTTASTAGLGLLGILGKVAAAAAVGYGIGTLFNDYVINPAVQKATGDPNQSLGGWIYDVTHRDERAALVGPQQQVKASGQIEVNFKNAPQGMQVEQVAGGDIPINTDVGYRGYAYD